MKHSRFRDFMRNLATFLLRAAWTLLIWGVFTLFVLGPLLTVLGFSLTDSVLRTGIHPTTFVHYKRLFSEASLYGPLLRSFEIAIVVVLIQLVFGTAVAYSTIRRKIFGAPVLDAMSNLTVALPSVVVGLALLSFYGPYGPFKSFTDLVLGNPLTLTWTMWIVIFAHVLETFPYMVRTVAPVLQGMTPNLEMAARSLGAGPWTAFRTIVLPQLKPSLLAGSALVFSRSIAEFGATIIVVSAVLQTAPVKIYADAEAGALEIAAAQSVVLMLISFAIYLIVRWRLSKTPAGLGTVA